MGDRKKSQCSIIVNLKYELIIISCCLIARLLNELKNKVTQGKQHHEDMNNKIRNWKK